MITLDSYSPADIPELGLINDYVGCWADRTPDAEALVMGDIRITYGELIARVHAEQQALWQLGLRPGVTVAVICPARPEFFTTFLAITSVGGIFQGLNPKASVPELAFQLEDSQASLLVWHGDAVNGEIAGQVISSLDWKPGLVGGTQLIVHGHGLAVADRAAITEATQQLDPSDAAAIVYTSGTTGTPKGALLSHYGFTKCSRVQAARWVGDAPPRMPCVEPINHVAALGDACVFALVAGGAVVFQEQFNAEEMLRLLVDEKVNLWYTDPAILSLCSRSNDWRSTDFSRIQRICWSGGRAAAPLVEELATRVPQLSTSWGMTETVGSLTYTDDNASTGVLSSTIGKFDEAFEGRVIGADGRPVQVGGSGELQVRGAHIANEYWKRGDATTKAFTADGWFRTGDLVTQWPDGNLELVGRQSEMFKSGGENIYPREVEAALEAHPAVVAAAVVGVPDDLWGEVGHAFVITTSPVDGKALREYLREHISRFKVPKRIEIAKDFPLLGSGKVDRQALRAIARKEPQ